MKTRMALVIGVILTIALSLYAKYEDEPDGFRDLKWEQKKDEVKDLELSRTDPSWGGIDFYTRKGDKLQIGSAELLSIEYGFWQNRLGFVTIKANGFANFAGIKGAVESKHGRGLRPNKYIEEYFWDGKITDIAIKYIDVSGDCILNFTSRGIIEAATEWKKEQDKNGAGDL